MALVDDITIRVKAGAGGDGGQSYKSYYGSTKKFPDGGNGGKGGNVYFQGTTNLNDLSEFRYKKEIRAEDGEKGMNKNLDGKYGSDITVLVPLGTIIIDTATQETIEILEKEVPVLIAKGGKGGIGNHDQKIVPGQITRTSAAGKPGEEKELHLILNLIADIGLVGLPNAGKSSLLATLTRATPKIGNYPFTTLEPNLGTVGSVVIADIPGLIEGASQGKGLGIQFLKHIQKTKMLMHCIDATDKDPIKTYRSVRGEFEEYDPELLKKEEIILLTKADLAEEDEIKKHIDTLKETKRKVIAVSIYDENSIEKLKKLLKSKIEK